MRVDQSQCRETLRTLESLWRRQGAPIAVHLRPGLEEDEVDALTAPLGLRLPVEARLWYGWHDGVEPGATSDHLQAGWVGSLDFRFLPLATAIEEYTTNRSIADDVSARGPLTKDELWDPYWFPLLVAMNGDAIVVDCSVDEGEATPVRVAMWESPNSQRVRAESLLAMVRIWTELLEQGAWYYSREQATWVEQPEMIDVALRLTNLV